MVQGQGQRDEGSGWALALWGLAWIGGVALQLQQPDVWAGSGYAWAAAGGVIALALALGGSARPRVAVLLAALALALLGFASTGARALLRLADSLPAALEGRDLVVSGVVATLPRRAPEGLRFEFEPEQATLDGAPVELPGRIALAWYRAAGETGADPAAQPPAPLRGLPAGDARAEPRAGERWRLPVRLKRPHGAMNPHGFDLELWMWERGLRASGSVRARQPGDAERLGDADGYAVARLRQRLRDRIDAQVDDPRSAGVVAALAIGDQGAVERADWELFRATGVVHLMVVSGLHVTMFAWLAAAAVGLVWRRSAALMRALPAPLAARWGGLALAIGYALLAGWGVPAQRTVLMLAVVVALRARGLRWPAPWVLLAAAVAVTLGDPWALLQPGFWLSFVAVALLMVSQPEGDARAAAPGMAARVGAALRAGLRTQVVATLGLAPLTLLFFQQLSLVGFAANLVAIPAVTLVATPLALAGAAWPVLWSAAAAVLQALAAALAWFASWPGALWWAAAAPPWAAAAGLLGGILLVLPLPWRVRALGAALLLPMAWPAPSPPAPGRFEAVALDVGQGTAVLVRTRGHLLVYDAGPAWGLSGDAGARLLLPLLRARGERAADMLLLSHVDSDHVGGAASLLASMPVAALVTTIAADHPLRAAPIPHRDCAAGLRWVWDGVDFELLHPLPGALPAPAGTPPNSLSCVLRVRDARGATLLLTGDLEAAQESALALSAPGALRASAMMVPHHGSRTSSSAALLDAVAPRIAFVQAAYRSRFGHPAPDVLARYDPRGIRVVRSDRCGAWTWDGEGDGRCERERSRRYWHHRP
ncbi:MAG: DNA internalization-related competence protein ComEC/Rec2 [Burkholderiales bacterium]|nr:DNA internalization-related competence protein ComEC/Rec2 [Burkholderiales bacterium]